MRHHRETPDCPRCDRGPADLIHMLIKRCPKLLWHWQEAVTFIPSVYQANIPIEPKTWLPNLIDDVIIPTDAQVPIIRLLYIARKVIAQKWLYPNPPTVPE